MVICQTAPAVCEKKGKNYELTLFNGRNLLLKRDVDFGTPKTQEGKNVFPQPCLYKAGAEQIRWEYGVLDKYTMLNAIRDVENGFFMYEFCCELIKQNPENGEWVTVSVGYGSANTREKNVGNASGFDVANTKLKIAEKRSLLDAVIKMARLSAIFTQDMENETFMNEAIKVSKQKDEDLTTPKQRQRLFAILAGCGYTQEQSREWLKRHGCIKTTELTVKRFQELCELAEREATQC